MGEKRQRVGRVWPLAHGRPVPDPQPRGQCGVVERARALGGRRRGFNLEPCGFLGVCREESPLSEPSVLTLS